MGKGLPGSIKQDIMAYRCARLGVRRSALGNRGAEEQDAPKKQSFRRDPFRSSTRTSSFNNNLSHASYRD